MADNSGTVWVATTLLATITSIVCGQAGDRTSQASLNSQWELEVAILGSAQPRVLWVGLVNRSGEARLVCINDRSINLGGRDETSRAFVEGGSPHGCIAEETFQLVRDQETLFTRFVLPPTLRVTMSELIRVELGIVERAVLPTSLRSEPTGVKWEGTLQKAAELGKALTRAAERKESVGHELPPQLKPLRQWQLGI